MKSLLITFCTLLFLVALSFIPMTASSGSHGAAGGHSGGGQHSWKPVEVWCYDYMGNFRRITHCDESGGACSDQYCPCTGLVIET